MKFIGRSRGEIISKDFFSSFYVEAGIPYIQDLLLKHFFLSYLFLLVVEARSCNRIPDPAKSNPKRPQWSAPLQVVASLLWGIYLPSSCASRLLYHTQTWVLSLITWKFTETMPAALFFNIRTEIFIFILVSWILMGFSVLKIDSVFFSW